MSRFVPEVMYTPLLRLYYFSRLKTYSLDANIEVKEKDLYAVKKLIRRGDHVVDIGANFGFYTWYLSKQVGDEGLVHSIEPVPLTYNILSYNVRKLKLKNVKLHHYAISEKNGYATMQIPKYDSGGESYYLAKIVDDSKCNPRLKKITVATKRLDSILLHSPKRITFMKIDVEGHELQAIMGASEMIEEFQPALLVEVSSDPYNKKSSACKLFSHLKHKKYFPYLFDSTKLVYWHHDAASPNCFFLSLSHVQNFISPNKD